VLPLLLLLLFGIAYFGLALNGWIDETHLATEAARFAAVNSEHGTGELKEASFLKWITEQGDSKDIQEKTKATICSPESKIGEYVEVKLTYTHDWVPILNLGKSSTITSTAHMRIEVPPSTAYPTTC
jgi:Flp pilus assembly protein TadG